MSANIYNQAYKSMKESIAQFKNPEEALSFYLEGASKYLARAAKSAEDGRIEDRSNLSDKALLIFSGILSHLEQSSSEEKKTLKPLMDYCYSMNELILRMNMKNDIEMAHSLASEVKRMADHWQEKSEEIFSRGQKNFKSQGENPLEGLSIGKSNGTNPSFPSLSSRGLSTADFSV